MSADKRAIRQELRERRKRLPAPLVEAAGVAVCARLLEFPLYQAAASVGLYLADENEVPTRLLIDQCVNAGRSLYLPRDAGVPAFVRWHPGTSLRQGRGGVQEPVDGVPVDLELPAIVLLPVVAWDDAGTRLGRGGGFYDRLLPGLDPRVVRVGLAYEFQAFPELPRDPWDVSMHYVITERRLVACGDGHPASIQKGGLQL
jgi:5-formyltetrahydrofolate cyclo-ligase